MSTGEIVCSYAALILYDDNIPITSEKLSALVNAVKVHNVESYWFSLFAKLTEVRNIGDLILNVEAGGGAPVVAAVTAGGAAGGAAAVEEKEEEPKEESDNDMRFSLFD